MKNKIMKKILSILLFSISIFIKAQIPNYVPSTGLVGWWPFTGNAIDSSGNGNNGTVNGATLTVDRFGMSNKAYSFNGTTSYISIPNNSSLNFQTQNKFSFSYWINAASLSSSQISIILSKQAGSGSTQNGYNSNIEIGYQSNFRLQNGSPNPAYSLSTSNNSITINSWYHIVQVWTGTQGQIYINGILVAQSFGTGVIGNNSFDLLIGQANWSLFNVKNFNGKIDDIGIWNRALTTCEVQALYSGSLNTIFNSSLITQDTIKACGDSVLVSATSGLTSYSWSNGKTTASIFAKSTGWYKVSATNSAGCSGMDSVFVSIIKANILNNDTAICLGRSVRLRADSILVSTPLSYCAPLPPNLQNGLVGYWPFCGNANDASGNGNNGTVNGATLTTDRFGNLNNAYNFNNNFIQVPSNSSLNNPQGTVNFWINTTGGNLMVPIKKNNFMNAANEQYSFALNFSNLLSLKYNSSCQPSIGWSSFGGNNPILTNGNWHMVTATYSTEVNVYIDGILKSTSIPPSSSIDICSGDIQFGREWSSFVNYYIGKLDDIGIWNRALTPQEIQQLYSSSYPQSYLWSTGDTTPTINVTPSVTTKYWVRVSNGSHFCTDTVTVTVSQPPTNLISQDTIKACGDSVLVSATSGLSSYAWNTGATTSNIFAKSTGWYKVTATNNAGCSGTDSVFVSIVKANILNNDTTICLGRSVRLNADSILGSSPLSSCAPLPANLQNGLVGYWPFCGNANDVSGNNNHGTVNGANLTTDRFGNTNKAYNFDGVDDFININNSNSLNPTSQITISAWVNTSAYNSSNASMVVNKGWDQGPGHYDLLVFSSNNKSRFVIGNNIFVESSSTVNINQWTLITASINSLTMKIYVNGVLENTVTQNNNNSFGTNTDPLYIGKHDYLNHPYFFNGIIDDIGIWNRALTPQEIQQLYTSSYPQSYLWSTGDTTPTINVTPTVTTKYWVRVSNGSHFCTDTVTVTVSQPPTNLISQDTIKACGDSVLVSATSGMSTYSWSNGKTTASFFAKSTGWYKITATNSAGCSGMDSVFVSIIKANILNNDTTICLGRSVRLNADSILGSTPLSYCAPLPANLQNGLVGFWPFCGNANDASGNGNNGTVNGATLTTDRFGNTNKAYNFDGVDDFISTSVINSITGNNSRTIAFWALPEQNLSNSYAFSYGDGAPGETFAAIIRCGIQDNIASITSSSFIAYNSDTNFCNKWNFYCIVFPNGGTIQNNILVYKNGILLTIPSSIYNPNTLINTSNFKPLTFGKLIYTDGYPSFFKGKLDDFLAWNRALTLQEIQQLYTPAYPQSYLWSTGDTTPTINVTPTVTTKYWVRVSNGSHFCTDTVTVTVNPKTISTINQTICQGQSFLGRTISGTYIDTLTGANSKGCDSIRTLNLTVNPKTTSSINQTICQGQSFLGRSISGTYIDTLIGANSKGCDSIRTLNLTVNPRTTSSINQTICQGQSFLGRSISGTYIDTLIGANSKGCDSIRTLNLTVNPRTTSSINQTICQGQSFLGRSISGTYIDTLIGANSKGCDSIRTLNLTVNPRTTSTINQTICQGDSFLGKKSTGIYVDTLFGANSKGCDSIRTLNLTVNPRTFSTINQTICQGDSFLGKKSTGIYVDTLFGANSKGCDSIRTLNLFVNSSIAPIALDSQIFCMSAQIKDLIITGNLIKWYQDSTKKIILNNNAQLSDNVTYYATQSLNNCESAIKKVKAYINSGNITSDKPNYCEGDTILLTFQSLFNKLLWFNAATTKTIKIIAQQIRSYTVDYTYRNKSCSTSINIISYPIPPKPIATSPQTYSNDNTLDDLIVTGNSLKWYEDSQLQKNIPSSTTLQNEKVYYVTQRENNCESEATAIKATLELKVLLDSIYVNNSMSPNNDQIMDAFTIENIHLAKNNKIQIANRWGEIVFEKENYQNDWYGEYLTNGYTNNTLPDGVYYYVFSFTIYGQKNEKTGYIYIKK